VFLPHQFRHRVPRRPAAATKGIGNPSSVIRSSTDDRSPITLSFFSSLRGILFAKRIELTGSDSNGTDLSPLAHPPSSGDFGEAGASRSTESSRSLPGAERVSVPALPGVERVSVPANAGSFLNLYPAVELLAQLPSSDITDGATKACPDACAMQLPHPLGERPQHPTANKEYPISKEIRWILGVPCWILDIQLLHLG